MKMTPKFGIGLGCNGIIQVLIEPINPDEPNNPIQLLRIVAEKREKAVVVTLFSLGKQEGHATGHPLAFKENYQQERNTPLKDILLKDGMKTLREGRSVFRTYQTESQSLTAFIELVEPAVSLIAIRSRQRCGSLDSNGRNIGMGNDSD
jgi:xanthine/CO dehydrogenase XdhC/CoxF family maturation factor